MLLLLLGIKPFYYIIIFFLVFQYFFCNTIESTFLNLLVTYLRVMIMLSNTILFIKINIIVIHYLSNGITETIALLRIIKKIYKGTHG